MTTSTILFELLDKILLVVSWIEIITSEPLELLLDIAEDNPYCVFISLVTII